MNVAREAKNRTSRREVTKQTSRQPHREYLFKVLVIGDLNTGKTSLIRRFVHHTFSQQYRTTIGVDFALKILDYNATEVVRLQLWDIAGQERTGNMTRVYYKDAVGCVVVYDVNNDATFEASERWKNDLDEKLQLPNGDKVPCLLFGNKKDSSTNSISFIGDKEKYLRQKGYVGWMEGSAKDDINIDQAFHFILSKIMEKNREVDLGVEMMSETTTIMHLRKSGKKTPSCCYERRTSD